MTPDNISLIDNIFNSYLHKLPATRKEQSRKLILFSGVPGSGKSTIARMLEKELHAIRISNDEIRNQITAIEPTIDLQGREDAKLKIATRLLGHVLGNVQGTVIIDASCDRSYDLYHSLAQKYDYSILILRLDIPRHIIEQRILDRHAQDLTAAMGTPAQMDIWLEQWNTFGKEHEPNMVITENTPIESVVSFVDEQVTKTPATESKH